MPNIKSASEIAKKWGRVTPQRTEDYEQGIRNPVNDWQKNALAAEQNYKTEVTKAANEGRYGRGVSKKGTAGWQEKAITKSDRWGPGVMVAEKDYEEGYGPYRDVIERTDIGPRYPKGDPRNYERSKRLGIALHDKKLKG